MTTAEPQPHGPKPRIRFFNTFEVVTSFYRDLLPRLVRSGFEAEVFVSAANYRSERTPLHESVRNPSITYRRTPTLVRSVNGRFGKLSAAVFYILFAAAGSLFGRRTDVNFFLTQPPLFSFWGLILKRLRGQRYACLLMDIYPDVLVQSGAVAKNNLLVKVATAAVRASWRNADAVFVIGRCMAAKVMDAGVDPSKIHLTHNWSDPTAIYPVTAEENSLRQEHGLENKFVVLYSGNMGVSHTFDEILAVADRLRTNDTLRFVFVGRGSRRRQIQQFLNDRGLTNILLLPFQPAERLAESLSMADLHLVTLRPGFEGLVVPSKSYGAMASGRPIVYIGSSDGEIARLVNDADVGTVVAPGDVEGLMASILQYVDDPEWTRRQAAASLRSAAVHDCDSALSTYIGVLEEICPSPPTKLSR